MLLFFTICSIIFLSCGYNHGKCRNYSPLNMVHTNSIFLLCFCIFRHWCWIRPRSFHKESRWQFPRNSWPKHFGLQIQWRFGSRTLQHSSLPLEGLAAMQLHHQVAWTGNLQVQSQIWTNHPKVCWTFGARPRWWWCCLQPGKWYFSNCRTNPSW